MSMTGFVLVYKSGCCEETLLVMDHLLSGSAQVLVQHQK